MADDSEQGPNAAMPKKLYAKDFDWGKKLGEGAYGEVILATALDSGQQYAIKVVNKKHVIQQKKVEWVNREKVLLDKLRHPNIVNLFYTFSSPENLHFVMEYCPHGELLDYIKKYKCFSHPVAQYRAAEVVSAVEFMTSQGVVHRDLKPENILVGNEMRLKLVDFGTAKEIGMSRTARSKSFVGTAQYVSPELLKDKEQGLAGDLWAVGVMIYQFVTGKMPFNEMNEYLTFQAILERKLIWPENIDKSAIDVVEQILDLNPDNRLGNREGQGFDELKNHPFFEGINWNELHTTMPPPFESPPENKMPIWPNNSNNNANNNNDTINITAKEEPVTEKKDDEKQRRLTEQKKTIWNQFVNENEMITKSGLITKKKRFYTHKRQLILTDKPRLFYVDPEKMIIKGEVTWCPELEVEAKNSKVFTIQVPHRLYTMNCVEGSAEDWVEAIKNTKNK